MIVLFVIWLVNMINMAADSVTDLVVIFILKPNSPTSSVVYRVQN